MQDNKRFLLVVLVALLVGGALVVLAVVSSSRQPSSIFVPRPTDQNLFRALGALIVANPLAALLFVAGFLLLLTAVSIYLWRHWND